MSNTQTKVRAIIDQGALFKDYSNVEVANLLKKKLNNHDLEFILFFDHNGKLSALPLDENSSEIITIGETDPSVIYKLLNVTPDKCFTYYDQSRCTGTDIKQAIDAHAYVTLSDKVTVRSLLQAAMRMRELNGMQKLEFILPAYFKDRINGIDDIIQQCLSVQVEKLAQEHLMSAKQQISAILVDNLLGKILNEQRIENAALMLQKSEDIFFDKISTSLFQQFGTQLKDLSTDMFLQLFAEKKLESWRTITRNIGIYDESEETKLDAEIQQVIAKVIKVCKETTTITEEVSEEQEQQQEQQQQEQEQEREQNTLHPAATASGGLSFDDDELKDLFEVNVEKLKNKNRIVDLNKVFLSSGIEGVTFDDRIYLSENFVNVADNQKKYLDYKRDITEILVVHNKKINSTIYLMLSPMDSKRIVEYCSKNLLDDDIELKIQTLQGLVHYEKNITKSLEIEDSIMQQLLYYNGNLTAVINRDWIKENFDVKISAISNLIRAHHPNRVWQLLSLDKMLKNREVSQYNKIEDRTLSAQQNSANSDLSNYDQTNSVHRTIKNMRKNMTFLNNQANKTIDPNTDNTSSPKNRNR